MEKSRTNRVVWNVNCRSNGIWQLFCSYCLQPNVIQTGEAETLRSSMVTVYTFHENEDTPVPQHHLRRPGVLTIRLRPHICQEIRAHHFLGCTEYGLQRISRCTYSQTRCWSSGLSSSYPRKWSYSTQFQSRCFGNLQRLIGSSQLIAPCLFEQWNKPGWVLSAVGWIPESNLQSSPLAAVASRPDDNLLVATRFFVFIQSLMANCHATDRGLSHIVVANRRVKGY